MGDNFALGLVSFVYYWIPPLIYLYIRTLAYDQQKLRKSDYLHFIIPILAFGLLLYYLSAGFIYKGRLIFPSREILSGIPSIIYVPATYHAIFICLMAICYAVACWSVVLKKFTRENLQHPQSRKIRNWILTLLIPTSLLTFIVSVSGVLWLLGYVQVTSELYYYQIIRAMLLIFVFSNVLINTELLFGLPDIKTILPPVKTQVVNRIIIPDSVQDKNISSLKEVVASESGNHLYDEFGWIKYSTDYEENDSAEAGVPIENDRAITYINEINEYLKTNPYTDPEFNMQSMSTALSIPVYHLEYLFRYYNKYSFATFRNIMRVQYVLN
ncbi:MAG TPA: hypothetical protein VIK74_03930, partial [Parasegetibacter sp.]